MYSEDRARETARFCEWRVEMNVLMLTSRMDIGGAESHVLTLSGALVRLGHRVIVASAGGRSVPALEESGARHVTLPLDKKDPASVYLARSGILRLCERFSPDVVHSHSRIPSFIYGELTGEGSRIPLVTTVHMPFSYDPLTEWGDTQIAVSRDLAAYLEEKYAIPARRRRGGRRAGSCPLRPRVLRRMPCP